MKCLIAGASGLVGHELLVQLLEDSRLSEVVAVGRSPLAHIHAKFKSMQVNFTQLEGTSLPPADVAFCCLGTTIAKAGSQEAFRQVDHDAIVGFARACQKAGVQTFALVSALGADVKSAVFYNRVKGQTEDSLRALGFSRLIVIRPSLLLGMRQESRPAEHLAQVLSRWFLPLMMGPLAKVRPVTAAAVARRLKSIALDEQTPGVHFVENAEI